MGVDSISTLWIKNCITFVIISITMKKFNVLYISGAVGLGHINRDLAIAYQLRKLLPHIEIE
jgi:hypothetical protein